MQKPRIDLVAGARPNFMKIAPIYHVLKRPDAPFEPRVIHTGQHYDPGLSDVFFTDLNLPTPDKHLGVGSGSVAEQTGRVLQAYGELLAEDPPDLTLVVGDVNSTVGCGLAAAYQGIPLAHLEAGLRSFDRTMPEELNRVLTDRISDLLLTPSADADLNLHREGVEASRIRFVGNIMIDALEQHREDARKADIQKRLGLAKGGYALSTLHRPVNVDTPERLSDLLLTLAKLSERMPIILPAHPRMRKNLERLDARVRGQIEQAAKLRFIDPVGYVDFLALETDARVVLTDSGGIQEETTVLGVPCLTLRESTERPVTISQGTNRLVGHSRDKITAAFEEAISLPAPVPQRPPLWDGRTAERVVAALHEFFRGTAERGQPQSTTRTVNAFALPCCEAHRSPEVRRELLLVAETGEWQATPDLKSLTSRLVSYARAPQVVLCADAAGGLAALRAHHGSGPVAILGGWLPDDIAAVLGDSAEAWPDLESDLPAGCRLAYAPPVTTTEWCAPAPKQIAAWAKRHPEIMLAVDERWFEYSGQSVVKLLATHTNVVSLRSLAPAFGLDGLGVGYMAAAKGTLPASVAAAAEVPLLPFARRAAMVALIDQGYMQEYVETRVATRKWLKDSLVRMDHQARELPGPHLYVTGTVPDCLTQSSCVVPFKNGWLWAVGTPEQVEDQLTRLQETKSKIGS